MLKYILAILLLISSLGLQAQVKKAEKAFSKFEKLMSKGQNAEALNELKSTIVYDPNHIKARKYLAQHAEKTRDYKTAYEQYNYLLAKDLETKSKIHFKAGEMAFMQEQYELAIEHFNTLLAKPNVHFNHKEKGTRYRGMALFIIEAKKRPVPFDPVSLGAAVNSQHHEYFPSMKADGSLFVFTKRLPRGKGQHQEDFYYTQTNEQGLWFPAKAVGAPINTDGNEGAASITSDGKNMFFTKCSDNPNDRVTYGSCDIFYAPRVGDQWGKPMNLGPTVNGPAWDAQASMSSDGMRLYFTSARPGGKGGKDIWYSVFKDGKWNVPVNAGDAINTPGNEFSPFIHPDGRTLYFSSDYHLGMGGTDYFMSRRNLDEVWSAPKNLGHPINTKGNEYELFIEADGEWAYMATERFSPGNLDIYKFKIPEDMKPKPVIYVKGKITDRKNKRGLGTDIELIDRETGETHTIAKSDAINGEYLVILPLGKNFAFIVDKQGYLFHSEDFSLKGADENEPYVINVALSKTTVGETTIMKNTFYETGSFKLKKESHAELNVLYKMLEANPNLKIEIGGHTDNIGSKAYNTELSAKRAKEVHDYLIRQGIVAERLSYKGYAFDLPIASNDTAEGRARNRRTEIKIIK